MKHLRLFENASEKVDGVSIGEFISLIEDDKIVFPVLDENAPFRDHQDGLYVMSRVNDILREYNLDPINDLSDDIRDKLYQIEDMIMRKENILFILKNNKEENPGIFFKPDSSSGICLFKGESLSLPYRSLKNLLIIFNDGVPVACSIIRGLEKMSKNRVEVYGFGYSYDDINNKYIKTPFIYEVKKKRWIFPFGPEFFRNKRRMAEDENEYLGMRLPD